MWFVGANTLHYSMSGAKTAPTSANVSDFIAAIAPVSKRDDAILIDGIYRRITGHDPAMWGPSIIGYGSYYTTYASGRDVHWLRAGFSPRKAKHSFYLMGGFCDDLSQGRRQRQFHALGTHALGKSCLYINRLDDVDLAVLEEILVEDWAIMERLFPL